MEHMSAAKPTFSRLLRRYLPWIMVLCLLFASNALSGDIFSIVFAQPSGTNTMTGGNVTVDISNAYQGYIMVKHNGSSKRLKARVTYSGTEYTYDLNNWGDYEAFPLQFGSGNYDVKVFENVKNSQYAVIFNNSFYADIPTVNAAFLVPSQYVWYTPTTAAIAKSFELCAGLTTDMERVRALYDYVGSTVMYDYIKALSVQKGYIPDIDETLNTKMGICFDYAALLACMLRVQGIPTQLAIGDLVSQGQYHAWNLAYVDGQWILLDPTFSKANYTASDYAMERYY